MSYLPVPVTDDELAGRLELALAATRAAGEATLRHFRDRGLVVDTKPDASPVTAGDREAEQILRRAIAGRFPGDAILGEEFGEIAGTSGWRWILDPIDGTRSYVQGVPLYGNLVGIEREGRSVIGVIRLPALGECVFAAAGAGAWQLRDDDGEPHAARVSATGELAQGLACTTGREGYVASGRLAAYERLGRASRLFRTWGDCYGYALVATGRAELMIDPRMSAWDAAPMLPIIEEAGGRFTDWRGRATTGGGEGIASNGHVHAEALALLAGL